MLHAAGISLLINLVMVLGVLVPGNEAHPSLPGRLSDWIAVPPGLIVETALSPKEHAAAPLAAATAESVVCSFLLYALMAWVALGFVHRIMLAAKTPPA